MESIPNYEEVYKVSNIGRVFKNGEEVKLITSSKGFKCFSICKNWNQKTFFVHTLVAKLFLTNPYKRRYVIHINGDRLDNNVNNLMWGTQDYNRRLQKSEIEVFNGMDKKEFCQINKMSEIPEHIGYLASIDGEIFSIKLNGFLKKSVGKSGYFQVGISNGNKIVNRRVNRLIAMAWIPNPLNKCCVNHKNCNKKDNRVDNLEWCTSAENLLHASLNGLTSKGKFRKGTQVINTVTGHIYGSFGEASKKEGIPLTSLYERLTGKCKNNTIYKIYEQ